MRCNDIPLGGWKSPKQQQQQKHNNDIDDDKNNKGLELLTEQFYVIY